jgi:hypothetical protein
MRGISCLNPRKDLHENLRDGPCKRSRFFHKQTTQAIIPLIEQSFFNHLCEVIFSGKIVKSSLPVSPVGQLGFPGMEYLRVG